jgi:hypothetical protein
MTRKERLNERDTQVRKLFYESQSKNSKWRIDAVVEEVATKMYLSSRTVEAILKYEGIYGTSKPEKVQLQFTL